MVLSLLSYNDSLLSNSPAAFLRFSKLSLNELSSNSRFKKFTVLFTSFLHLINGCGKPFFFVSDGKDCLKSLLVTFKATGDSSDSVKTFDELFD